MTTLEWLTDWRREERAVADARHAAEVAKLRRRLTAANEEIGALKRQLAEAKGETWKPE